jgi:hypothetical protein
MYKNVVQIVFGSIKYRAERSNLFENLFGILLIRHPNVAGQFIYSNIMQYMLIPAFI